MRAGWVNRPVRAGVPAVPPRPALPSAILGLALQSFSTSPLHAGKQQAVNCTRHRRGRGCKLPFYICGDCWAQREGAAQAVWSSGNGTSQAQSTFHSQTPPSSSLEAFLGGNNFPETNWHLTLKNSGEKRAFTHFNETSKKREENQLFSS